MSRDWRLYWHDIIECCRRVLDYTAGMDRSAFEADQRTFDAALRNIQIIGEATKHLPNEAKDLAPHIEWREIAGMRDVLTHAYFGVDKDIVWEVVSARIPELLSEMHKVGPV